MKQWANLQQELNVTVLAIGTIAQAWSGQAQAGTITSFTTGDLVISTVSCSVGATICNSTSAGLDTAAPIVLQQFQLGAGGTSATPNGTLTLPSSISGEYGSASEGILQQSANGRYLTMMGDGVNATAFKDRKSVV